METLRILLVEDNPVDALCLKEALKASKGTNFQILHVETLAEAKERLGQGDFHAVVLDLGLPDSQGIETLLGVKNSGSDVPIVVLSGLDDETLAIKAAREGAQDYLLKDKRDAQLIIRSLQYAIERHQLLVVVKQANESSLRANRALRVLSECSQLLVRATEERGFRDDICRILVDHGGYRMAWIGSACQDEAKTVQPQATAGFEDGYLQAVKITWSDDETGQGPTGTAIRTGITKVNRNSSSNPEYKPWRSEALKRGYASSIALPLIDHDEIFGALAIYSGEPDAFDAEEVKLLQQLADDLSYGINTLRTRAEKEKADLALRETEQRYRALFEESTDGIYSVLKDGTVMGANPSFVELFGTTTKEMIGKDIREFCVDPADYLRFQEEVEKKAFVKDYEIKLRKKHGTEIDCLLTSSVEYGDDGSIVGYRGIVRDVTGQKQLQRQLFQAQKMESIGTLAGGIAHDFNNLLTVILGFSELLLAGKDPRDPTYDDLEKIHQAAKSGADLVKSILAFSRKAEFNPRSLNLSHELERAKQLLTRTVPKMIEVVFVSYDELSLVNADPIQIQQIVMNLAVNARDAMPDGGKLTIETKNVSLDEEYCRMHLGAKPGDYVMLSVSDTGHGMDQETLVHIFEPFYTTKEPGKGTGLGLAMVYGLVKQHGGYVTCDSVAGMGTIFKIYLPVIPPDGKSEAEPEKPSIPGGTETVLLVDDDDLVRDLGKRILERSGYTPLTASNGKEALELYRKERTRISLVILDIIMPEMGGKQCLEELLKIDSKARVLISTGFATNGQTKEAIERGARGFISKPYNVAEMLQAVREVLDSK